MRPGTLFAAVVWPEAGGTTDRVAHIRLPGDRDTMRQLSVISALDLLRRSIIGVG
jgi:nicotinamide mononucleotide (NMN) deamidase PncC